MRRASRQVTQRATRRQLWRVAPSRGCISAGPPWKRECRAASRLLMHSMLVCRRADDSALWQGVGRGGAGTGRADAAQTGLEQRQAHQLHVRGEPQADAVPAGAGRQHGLRASQHGARGAPAAAAPRHQQVPGCHTGLRPRNPRTRCPWPPRPGRKPRLFGHPEHLRGSARLVRCDGALLLLGAQITCACDQVRCDGGLDRAGAAPKGPR